MDDERYYSPPAEQIFYGRHNVGVAHEKALFYVRRRLIYHVVLALNIVNALRKTRR